MQTRVRPRLQIGLGSSLSPCAIAPVNESSHQHHDPADQRRESRKLLVVVEQEAANTDSQDGDQETEDLPSCSDPNLCPIPSITDLMAIILFFFGHPDDAVRQTDIDSLVFSEGLRLRDGPSVKPLFELNLLTCRIYRLLRHRLDVLLVDLVALTTKTAPFLLLSHMRAIN
jgi:hypothetical protein